MGGGGDRKGGGAAIAILIAIAIVAIAWVLSIVIRFALSRSREYLADAGAVELTKNPDAMITALRKIEGRGELKNSVASIMEMCVDNPHSGFVDIFSTHPTIPKRVAALVQTAGGRDPGPMPSLVELQDPFGEIRPRSRRSGTRRRHSTKSVPGIAVRRPAITRSSHGNGGPGARANGSA
jgi:heat shock protein HtpX